MTVDVSSNFYLLFLILKYNDGSSFPQRKIKVRILSRLLERGNLIMNVVDVNEPQPSNLQEDDGNVMMRDS